MIGGLAPGGPGIEPPDERQFGPPLPRDAVAQHRMRQAADLLEEIAEMDDLQALMMPKASPAK